MPLQTVMRLLELVLQTEISSMRLTNLVAPDFIVGRLKILEPISSQREIQ
jgi:hypothetical protein